MDGQGAVALDHSRGTLVGYDRARGRVWEDRSAVETSAVLTCYSACPDVVSSSVPNKQGLNSPPVRLSAKGSTEFPVSRAPHVRVLSARSTTDAVVEEGDARGRSWLRIVRRGGSSTIDVAHRGYRWTESADGKVALAYPENAAATNGDMLWFSRGTAGWQLRKTEKRGTFVTACLTADGSTAVLAGEQPAVLHDGGARTPAAAGLSNALDCTAGQRAMALIGRSMRGRGYLTVVHGLDDKGTARWKRELPVEATVTAHPSKPVIGIADGRSFVLVDSAGKTVWRRDHLRSATFTRDGQLVVVTPAGTVEWLPSPALPAAP